MEKDKYRQLFIELTNGKVISCIIPNTLTDAEIKKGLSIKSIQITKAKKMPKGTYFDIFDSKGK